MIGLITLAAQWKVRSRHKDQPFPPLRWILLGAAIASLIMTPQTRLSSPDPTGLGWDFAWSTFLFALPFAWLPELMAIWLGGTLMFTGIATLGWWFWHLLGIRRPAKATTAKPKPSSPPDSPAVIIACDRCRAAAKTGGGEPLTQITESADGQRFLYRCGGCGTFWERDAKGTRVIPVLRARRDFPMVTI
jgi:hypothetical protein